MPTGERLEAVVHLTEQGQCRVAFDPGGSLCLEQLAHPNDADRLAVANA